MGSTNDYNELFTASFLSIYSNFLPYRSILIQKSETHCIEVKSLPLSTQIEINRILLIRYKSNFVIIFALTTKQMKYLLIISQVLFYEYKFITNNFKKEKKELPIIQSDEITITVTPIENRIATPVIYDISILNRMGKSIPNNPQQMIKNKRIREEESIKGKSINEIYFGYLNSNNKK